MRLGDSTGGEDVRASALAEAQKVGWPLVREPHKAREKLLSEAHQAVLVEVWVQALAKAQPQVLAVDLEGVQALARIQELAEARMLEKIQGMKMVVDEERVLELASKGLEQAERRVMRLAEEKVMEVSEESL